MTAQELANTIGQFISDNRNNRKVSPILSDLQAVQRDLKRIGSIDDRSNPSPGQKVAQRAQTGSMPPGLMKGATGG